MSACLPAGSITSRTPARCPAVKTTQGSVHLGLGVRRAFTPHNDFGTRIEFDNVDGKLFMALRAIDYRRRIGTHFAASFFLGAARYEGPTPAYGWYGGVGVQWRDMEEVGLRSMPHRRSHGAQQDSGRADHHLAQYLLHHHGVSRISAAGSERAALSAAGTPRACSASASRRSSARRRPEPA